MTVFHCNGGLQTSRRLTCSAVQTSIQAICVLSSNATPAVHKQFFPLTLPRHRSSEAELISFSKALESRAASAPCIEAGKSLRTPDTTAEGHQTLLLALQANSHSQIGTLILDPGEFKSSSITEMQTYFSK